MTAAHGTVQSGQKHNEHVSITNMAKRDAQNILLLWKCWNSASCLTFIVTSGRCLCSFLLLKYRVLHSHCTVGAKERSEPETDYTFHSLCYINWATQNYELYGEAMFVCCIVCVNLFIAWQHITILVSITHSSLTDPYTILAYPLQNTA